MPKKLRQTDSRASTESVGCHPYCGGCRLPY